MDKNVNLDKIIYAVVFVALIISQLWFLAVYEPHQISPVGKYVVRVERGEFIVEWARNTGAIKPMVWTKAQKPIIELSAWSGGIRVAGMEKPRELWLSTHTVESDEDSIFVTYSREEYIVEEIIKVKEDHVSIRHNVLPPNPEKVLHNVEIVFDYYNWNAEFIIAEEKIIIHTPHGTYSLNLYIPPDDIILHEHSFSLVYRHDIITKRTVVAEHIIKIE